MCVPSPHRPPAGAGGGEKTGMGPRPKPKTMNQKPQGCAELRHTPAERSRARVGSGDALSHYLCDNLTHVTFPIGVKSLTPPPGNPRPSPTMLDAPIHGC